MDIEKAKERLKGIDIKAFLSGMAEQSNYIVDKADETNTAIETVLSELEKKDKVINEMAKEIYEDDNIFGFGIFKDINTPEKIKEYSTKKVEGK